MEQNYYKQYISIEEANKKFRLGIAQGLYGVPYHLRILQFNPAIISIGEGHFKFGMYKHCGVFRASISTVVATHWGIKQLA